MVGHEPHVPATHAVAQLAAPRPGARAGYATVRYAALTLALSLPQGLLALPIAVARAGLGAGLLALVVVGLLNVATASWIAQQFAADARPGSVPSLAALAAARVGWLGQRAALAGGASLFFLALVASLVGLGRSFTGLVAIPAPLVGLVCGLVALALSARRVALSARLLVGLGYCNVGLILLLILLAAPLAELPAPLPPSPEPPVLVIGVSLMLFFAPMLVPTVARQTQPAHRCAQALVAGTALGVAATGALALLWTTVVCGVVPPAELAGAAGTVTPLLAAAAPSLAAPALLLQTLLLGMTALRCTVVLWGLVEERPLRRSLQHAAHLPAVVGVAAAVALLISGASFTLLVAIAGGAAASLVSLVTPALLALAPRQPSRARAKSGARWPQPLAHHVSAGATAGKELLGRRSTPNPQPPRRLHMPGAADDQA